MNKKNRTTVNKSNKKVLLQEPGAGTLKHVLFKTWCLKKELCQKILPDAATQSVRRWSTVEVMGEDNGGSYNIWVFYFKVLFPVKPIHEPFKNLSHDFVW